MFYLFEQFLIWPTSLCKTRILDISQNRVSMREKFLSSFPTGIFLAPSPSDLEKRDKVKPFLCIKLVLYFLNKYMYL